MSHIDMTPRSVKLLDPADIWSSALPVAEVNSRRCFARGLVFGLALGLTFWTVLALLIFFR